jgi:hypothetical protein
MSIDKFLVEWSPILPSFDFIAQQKKFLYLLINLRSPGTFKNIVGALTAILFHCSIGKAIKPRTFRKANTYCWPCAFESIVKDLVDVEDENIPLRAIFLWHCSIWKAIKPRTFRKANTYCWPGEQHSYDIVPFEKLKPHTFGKANTYCWPGAFESIVGDLVDVEDENIPLRATFLW